VIERRRLPNRRPSVTLDFEVHGLRYGCSYSCFADGRLAEVFLNNHKAGSQADASCRDAAVAASLALQFGCPVEVLRGAILRDPGGAASSPLGHALDLIAAEDEP
jgi:ribonucleoside-diphosphate reductase alpha chain